MRSGGRKLKQKLASLSKHLLYDSACDKWFKRNYVWKRFLKVLTFYTLQRYERSKQLIIFGMCVFARGHILAEKLRLINQ